MATQFGVDLIFGLKGDGKIQQAADKLQGVNRAAKKAQGSVDALTGKFTKSGQAIRQSAGGLEYFTDKLGRAHKLNGQFVTSAEAAANGITRTGRAASRAGNEAGVAAGGFKKLAGAVGGLVSAYAAIQVGKFVLFKTAELETQTRSLQVLTGSLKEAQTVISELQSFAAVTPITSTELIETAKRLKAFGVDTEKLVETTKRLGDVAGATGAELSGIATAYGQIQAKGRLQGEELLQLQERGIGLQGELQKMYQLSGDEFREALEKGRISAEAVEVAIRNLTEAGGQYANGAVAQSDTLNGRFSTLQDAIDQTARLIGAVMTPAINEVLRQAIQAINTINNLLAAGARAKKFGLNQRAQKGILDQATKEAEEIVNLRRIADPFERNRVFQEIRSQREKDLVEAYGYRTGQIQAEVTAPKFESSTPPALLGGTSKTGGGGGKKGKSEREKQLEKEAALAKRMEEQYKRLTQSVVDGNVSYAERLNTQQRLNALLLEGFSPEKAQEQVAFETEVNKLQRDRAKKLEELRGIEGITQDKLVTGEQTINQAFDQRIRSLYEEKQLKGEILERTEAQKKAEEELNALRQIGADALNAAGTQITGMLDTLIQGTDDWNKVLQNALKSLSSMLLKFGIKALAGTDGQGFFSFLDGSLKGFASGGRPPVGKPSIVGERGPELFVPGTRGTIIPNDQLGGGGGVNSVVNVTINSDGSSNTDASQGEQLGRQINSAVKAIIMHERRPGGLLAR